MQVNKLKEDCKKVCINVFKSTKHPYGNNSDSPTKLESVPGTNQYLVMTVVYFSRKQLGDQTQANRHSTNYKSDALNHLHPSCSSSLVL